MKLRLSYPRSHTRAQLMPLYSEFRELHPDVYDRWVEIEGKGVTIEPGDLADVHAHVDAFLRERTESENHLERDIAFLDLRKILVKEHLGYDLVPGQEW